MKHAITKLAAIAALSTIALEAGAQSFLQLDTMPAILGFGVGSVPDYRGSANNTGAVAPFFRYSFSGSERYLQLNATELTLNIMDSTKFRFGPVLNYIPKRDEDVDDQLVKQMQKIDGSIELGVFGEVAWMAPGNPRNRFVIGLTLLHDVSGEGDGFRARLNARYWQQVSTAVDLHIGGGLWYADGSYTNHYFGVNPVNRGTSGLPFYNAGSGLNEYFMTLGGLAYFSRNWLGLAGMRFSKLTGDAKDSPIVNLRGDATQVMGGVGVGYMWH